MPRGVGVRVPSPAQKAQLKSWAFSVFCRLAVFVHITVFDKSDSVLAESVALTAREAFDKVEDIFSFFTNHFWKRLYCLICCRSFILFADCPLCACFQIR